MASRPTFCILSKCPFFLKTAECTSPSSFCKNAGACLLSLDPCLRESHLVEYSLYYFDNFDDAHPRLDRWMLNTCIWTTMFLCSIVNMCVCFLYFSDLLLAKWIIICGLVLRNFYHSWGMFHDKGKEWIIVITYSFIVLAVDSNRLQALYHVILLRTRWYIIVPTLAIESLDYERLSGDVLQVTRMASDKTLIRTHSFRPCLVLTVSYIFIWRPEGMLPRRIWAYPTACRDASNVSSKWTAWAMRVLPFWRNALCRGNALGMSYCLAHPGRLVPTGQLPSIESIMSQFCARPFQRSHTWEKS